MIPKGDRIQLTFVFQGKRFRPTLELPPTAANLKHARRQLERIKQQISNGSFSFAESFPDYRFIEEVSKPVAATTFGDVADRFLASIGDLEYATRESYRKIVEAFWRPKFGAQPIADIRYSDLAAIIGGHPWGSVKTRNNVLSVGKRIFGLAYADEAIDRDPTDRLKSLRVQRVPPDPYTIAEAETLISAIRDAWGSHAGNYAEFGFFTGCRPSELIALLWSDVDMPGGTVRIDKARVMAQNKNRTKTATVREIELCPRALDVLRRQRELTGLRAGHIFTQDDGEPFHDLQIPWKRWQFVHKKLTMRYREPYQMRHTSVTWNLMIGKNLLWVADQHGHSAAVMLKTYAKWLRGATEKSIDDIRAAMGFATHLPLGQRANDAISLTQFGNHWRRERDSNPRYGINRITP